MKVTLQFDEAEIRLLDDIVAHDQAKAICDLGEDSTLQMIRGKVRVALNRIDSTPRSNPRMCTCAGACRGPAGLAPGWECAIQSAAGWERILGTKPGGS